MFLLYEVNYVAVILAGLASFIFGFVWYGPIFGKTWMKENNIKKNEQKMSPFLMLSQVIITLVLVCAFASIYSVTSINLFNLALLIWAGFFLTTRIGSMLWMPKASWNLFWIDISYSLLNLMIIAIILGLF